MTSTYVNDLRLNEMATGDQSGSWGTVTNTNLELIAEAFSYGTEGITTNANTHSTLIANGATDPGRSLFLKYTGTLDSNCTVTISAGASATDFTVSKMWFVQNGTSGGFDLIITSGSGADVRVPFGQTKIIYTDGAGGGGAVVDALADLSVPSLFVKNTATGDNSTALLTLQTGEEDIAADDVIGKISFQAPNETTGTDAILVAAAIQAISEGDFSSSSNATSLNFMTGASEAAATKMTLSSGGNLDVTGDITGSTLNADGDTSAGDNAALGYTAALGAILTGQGSTNDITLVNDADATVVSIPTGTTNVTVAGKLGVGGDTAAGDDAAIGYTAAEGLILTGQGSTSDITVKNDADATVFTVPTGTDDILFPDSAKAMFGAGSDLQIFYDGSNAFINNTVAGALSIKSDDINLMSSSSETMAAFVEDGAVTLYHNNAAKIATSATGVSVTGTAVATTDTDTSNTGSVTLDFGANQNFVLTLTGNTTLANPSTEQVGQSGFIACIQDGTGSRTLSLGTDYETAGGSGITLTTTASATDLIPYVVVASGRILLGTPQLAFS